MMLIKVLKTAYLIISVLCFCFLGLLSLVGGHGHFNFLTLKSIFILLSGIFLMAFFNRKSKVDILIMMGVFLLAIYSFISVILDFISVGNPRHSLQFKIFNILLYMGVISLVFLLGKKILSLRK